MDNNSGAMVGSPVTSAATGAARGKRVGTRCSEVRIFYVSLLILTLVSLWPIWATRFLPLQDYPQHLFMAQIIATYNDPSFNWKEFYQVDLGISPYMLWYAAMRLLAGIVSIESAGKVLFSLYILLTGVLVLVSRRLTPPERLPWGALLLYPFAFNQMYFMGFSNYVISLPLIFLALLDLDSLANGASVAAVVRHGIYMALLFLSHPYSLLVYIALALTSALFRSRNRSQLLRTLLPAVAMTIIFATWYLARHGASTAPTTKPWAVHWLPMYLSLAHYMLQFTGMRLSNGADSITVALWSLVAVLLYDGWKRGDKGGESSRRFAAWYLVSVAGFLVLPSWMGYYSYFNLRLAPVSYFALSLLLCRITVSLRIGVILTLLVFALLVQSIRMQKAAALETEAVLPVVSVVPRNSLILPLVFRAKSDVIDPLFFGELHANEAVYYHVLVGGGANPVLFPNAMMPVQYRPGLRLPYPKKVEQFSWLQHGIYYDYVLARGAPREVHHDLAQACEVVATSGPWVLFKNKSPRIF